MDNRNYNNRNINQTNRTRDLSQNTQPRMNRQQQMQQPRPRQQMPNNQYRQGNPYNQQQIRQPNQNRLPNQQFVNQQSRQQPNQQYRQQPNQQYRQQANQQYRQQPNQQYRQQPNQQYRQQQYQQASQPRGYQPNTSDGWYIGNTEQRSQEASIPQFAQNGFNHQYAQQNQGIPYDSAIMPDNSNSNNHDNPDNPNNPNNNPKGKPKKLKKVSDYIIWSILAGLSVLTSYLVFNLNMLSNKYVFAIMGVLAVICLGYVIGIACRKKKTWRMWVSRVSMAGMACVLAFASYTVYNGNSALMNMMSKDTTLSVSLVTRSNGDAVNDINDLQGKVVGYSTASDKSAICFALSNLYEEQPNAQYKAFEDYDKLYQALTNNELDAIIVPDSKTTTLNDTFEGYSESTKSIHTYKSVKKAKDAINTLVSKEDAEKPFVVYLAGIDEGDDPSIDTRTDVNILLFINQKEHMITTISVPRDSFVPNPALQYGSDKLTHLGMDGVYNSMLGLEQFFGIKIDYYAKVNFYSLIHLVDAIGGVDVNVEIGFTEQDENRSFAYNDLITLEQGNQHLNGKQALAYARHRKTYPDGASGRERAQQRIISAMIKKISSAEGLSKINNLLDVAEQYVSTDVPLQLVQHFIKNQTENNQPWAINSLALDNYDFASLTTVSMPGIPLSCQLLSDEDVKLVYNTYLTLHDEGIPVKKLIKKQKALDKAIAEAEANGSVDYTTNTYILPEGTDETFMEKIPLPSTNDYAITKEKVPYYDSNTVYYGLTGVAGEEEVNTRLRLDIPAISTGYYNKVTQ